MRCPECDRVFDLADPTDAAEWAYGHDCEPPKPGRRACPLADDWRSWSPEKRADRLFMVCPACGASGSHVQTIDSSRGVEQTTGSPT